MKIILFIVLFILGANAVYLVLYPLITPSFESGIKLISGRVNSLPVFKEHHRLQFDFKTNLGILNCNWYGLYPSNLSPGSRLELTAHIKPWREVRVSNNFDYRWYLLTHGYSGSCSIENKKFKYLDESNESNESFEMGFFKNNLLDYWRSELRLKIWHEIKRMPYQGIMMALILGDKSGLSQDDWTVFRNTGTSHLVAISGLHIGLMAMVGFWLAWIILTMSKRLCELSIIPNLALGFSWCVALLYSGMAGFSVPTERSLIMISVFIFSKFFGYRLNSYVGLCFAAVLIILINPWSVFYAGTWLSFMAVFFLIYGYQQYKPEGFFRKLFYPQWIVFIGLLPLSIYWFSQFSTLAFMTNCIAIPYMSFIVIPGLMLSVMFLFIPSVFFGEFLADGLAHGFFYINNFLLMLIWKLLSFYSNLPYSHIPIKTPSVLSVIAGTLGAIILLTPKWRWRRLWGFVFLLPLLIF